MKTKVPRTRRKFRTAWDEIGYLYDKVLYWFYDRQLAGRARPYARRLQKLLARADTEQESIWGQECRSLASELEGDLAAAIRYREEEIRKIRRLHQICENTAQWQYAVQDRYDYSDLSNRLDLLALLYDEAGDTPKAIRILEESKEYCRQHGIPFDGQDILEELTEDLKHAPARNGKGRRKAISA